MKVLVTGGAGFIGSHLVDELVALGHEVAVVDSLVMGVRANVNEAARFHQVDILDERFGQVFRLEKPDIVYHLAAQGSVAKSLQNPVEDATQNVLGSLRVITLCLGGGVRRLVFASSVGTVYGQPEYLPVDESHIARPICPYGVSKCAVERYLYLYSVNHGLDYLVLRLGNVYGPRQNPKGEAGVVAIFMTQMLGGIRPTIFGDGIKSRDYAYVGDVVKGMVLAMDANETRDVFNIGMGVETTDRQVFELTAELVGWKEGPVFSPARTGEVTRISLDARKASYHLGWIPSTTFEDGLARALEHYRHYNKLR